MKQIIWSSDALLDETAREYYQNFKREELDDDAYKVSDEEWSDEVYNELGDRLLPNIKSPLSLERKIFL